MVKTEPLDEYQTEEYQRALRLYTRRVRWNPEEDAPKRSESDSSFTTDDNSDRGPSPFESLGLSKSSIRPSTPEYEPLYCSVVSMDQIWRTYENTVAAVNVLCPHNDSRAQLLDFIQGPLAPNYPPPMYPQAVMIPSIPSPPASPSPPPSPPVTHPVRPALVTQLHPRQFHPYFPNHRNIPKAINSAKINHNLSAHNLLQLAPFTAVQLGFLTELLSKIMGNATTPARITGPSEERVSNHRQSSGVIGKAVTFSACGESPKIPRTARKTRYFSQYQLDILWKRFEENQYIQDEDERDRLARVVGLTGTQVNTWFLNTRARLKKGKDSRSLGKFGGGRYKRDL